MPIKVDGCDFTKCFCLHIRPPQFRRRIAPPFSSARLQKYLMAGEKFKKMEQDLFSNLPSEITMDILVRLPARMIVRCKSVCNTWLNMIESREFCDSHLSKSVPGLYEFQHSHSNPYEIHELNTNKAIFNFNFLQTSLGEVALHSSVNGLLLLCSPDRMSRNLLVCNPITREYIHLPPPPSSLNSFRSRDSLAFGFGFGVSRMSGQYKIVRITPRLQSKCEVYTLGTGGVWRTIDVACGRLHYRRRQDDSCPLLNGNLHWLALDDSQELMHISCFDLETELFTTFCLTHLVRGHSPTLSVLDDCLCLCDYDIPTRDVVIWLMKDYGDNESWTKEFIIKRQRPSRSLFPLKVFKYGDILVFPRFEYSCLLFFSSKTKAIIDCSGPNRNRNRGPTFQHTPSFLSLHKTFATENVKYRSGAA